MYTIYQKLEHRLVSHNMRHQLTTQEAGANLR